MEPDSREYVANGPNETERNPFITAKIRKSVLSDIHKANNFFTSKVEPTLRIRHQIYTADKAYYDNRFKNTAEQSDFVSFDFWSMVEWAIPNIMNAFFGSDDALVIVGRSAEDVPRAEVFKQLIDFQLMTQNKGFLTLWDWFTDAFQYNLGAVKVWWDRSEEWGEEQFEYADMSRVAMLQADQWCEITRIGGPDLFGNVPVWYRIGRLKRNQPVIEPVRVTDLRWSPEAKSIKEANFVTRPRQVSAYYSRQAHKELTTYYDMLMGNPVKPFNAGELFASSQATDGSGQYWNIKSKVKEFQKKVLHTTSGFYGNERSKYIRQAITALNYGYDKKQIDKYFRDYARESYITGIKDPVQAWNRSIKNLDPLNGLNERQKAQFWKWLSDDERKDYPKARKYFKYLEGRLLRR